MRRSIRLRLFAVVLLLGSVIAGPAAAAAASRIVAVGDVHGMPDQLLEILREAELVDREGRWSGGEAILVQTGDVTDRGARVRDVLDLLMRLQKEAAAAGGRVEVLLGNHEGMNLAAIFRDVSPEAMATFAGPEAEAERRRELAAWERRQQALGTPAAEEERAAWLARHPPGFFEYAEALGPDGVYGGWLRERPAVARVGDTLFVHGGIAPGLAKRGLEEINATIRRELETLDRHRRYLDDGGLVDPGAAPYELRDAAEAALAGLSEEPGEQARRTILGRILSDLEHLSDWLLFAEEGPLWFRGYARWSDEELAARLPPLLARYEVERIVAGHTPQQGSILSRAEGRLLLIDTAMWAPGGGGRPAAIVIEAARASAIYPGEREPLAGEEEAVRWYGPDGQPLPFHSDEEILEFLREARVVASKPLARGVTKAQRLLLERDGVRAHATFHDIDLERERVRMADGKFHMHLLDSWRGHWAAYELGRMLGFDNIPPVVSRQVREPGAVTLWIENAEMEADLRGRGESVKDTLDGRRRSWDMAVFDNLIGNVDRHMGNVLSGPDRKLWLIDHTRSFGRITDLHAPEAVARVSRDLWQRLRNLDEAEVRRRLSHHLGRNEVTALLKRREKLLRLLEERIATQGEEEVLFEHGDPDDRVKITYGE